MKFSTVLASALLAVATTSQATVVYSSIPDLTVAPAINAWCSDCYGGSTFEPLDQFTLSAGSAITGFNLVTQTGYFEGLSGFTVEIYDAAHASILFSQAVTPSVVLDTAYGTSIVTASLTGLTLAAGTYWFGAIAPILAVPGFSGGNGTLIDTTPHTGNALFPLGGNTGYELLGGVPESATWAMMIAGFGLVGAAMRRRAAATA